MPEDTANRPLGAIKLFMLIFIHTLIYTGTAFSLLPADASSSRLALAVCLGTILLAISVIDIQRFEIPDFLSLTLFGTGLVSLLLVDPSQHWLHILAGAAFPLILYSVGHFYQCTRSRTGVGLGDVKLSAGLGLWLGVEVSIFTLLAASLAGIVTLLAVAMVRRTALSQLQCSGIAFGPFLCFAAWVFWVQRAMVGEGSI